MKRILMAAVLATLCLPLSIYGSIFTYHLNDHPDGNQNPPPYGLRLDNVFTAASYGGVTSFSFDSGLVKAEINDVTNTMRIFGDIHGGVDNGNGYTTEVKVALDYTYTNLDLTGFDPNSPDLEVPQGSGAGTIEILQLIANANNLAVGQIFGFSSKPDQSGVAFNFKDTLHRGYDGINGWGWQQLDSGYGGTHDFLFTATVIPEPGSLAIWSLIGVTVGACWRRRK